MKYARLSVRVWLLLLALGAAVPLAALSTYAIYQLGSSQRQSVVGTLQQRSEATASAIQRRLDTASGALAGLSVGRAARNGELPALYDNAKHLLAKFPEATAITLVSPDGEMVFNTLQPYGTKLASGFDLPSLRRILDEGKPSASAPFIGPYSKQSVVAVGVPVLIGGTDTYALRMIIKTDALVEVLREQHLPREWIAVVADKSATVVARTLDPERFVGGKIAPDAQRALAERRRGVFTLQTLENIPATAVIAEISSWEWAVVVAVPTRILNKPLNDTLWKVGLGATFLLTAAVVTALIFSRYLSRQVSKLVTASHALASGEAPRLASTLVAEFNDAGTALERAREREQQATSTLSVALAASRQLLQDVIDAAEPLVYAYDLDGRCLLASRNLCLTLGKAPEQVVGHKREEFMAPGAAARRRAFDVRVAKAGTALSEEEEHPQDDGVHTYLTMKFPLRDAEGQIYGVAGISTDITDRKAVEHELRSYRDQLEQQVAARTMELEEALAGIRQSEERFRLLFNSSNDAILVHGFDPRTGGPLGRFVEVNDMACRRLGFSRDELLNMAPADIDDPSTPTMDDKVASLVSARSAIFERLHVAKNGRRIPVEINARKFSYQGMPFVMSIVRDISERKALEEELRRSNADLEQFAYVTSHDLRQPLRMVTSYLTLIERRFGDLLDADGHEFIGYARDGALQMDRLILDLLEYSRIGRHGENTPVDLAEVAAGARHNLTPLVEETGCTLAIDGADALVSGNSTELMRLFQNLIGNAIKYHAPDRAPVVEVGWQELGQEWEIWVRDNGIGIQPEQRERVFGIFQRLHTSAQYEGTGIGLAICKKIVERHGGRIWIEAPEGDGTVFRFTLPKLESMAAE